MTTTQEESATRARGAERAVAGRQLPRAGTWKVDPGHSSVGFSVRHATVTDVRGRFAEFGGTIEVAEDVTESKVAVSIRAASLDTANAARDGDVRGPDWLDAERFPTIEFGSHGVEADGLEWRVRGELTVRGESRPVVLVAEYVGVATTPRGEERMGFRASTTIDRCEFGVAANVPLATGGWFVAHAVHLRLDVSAVRA